MASPTKRQPASQLVLPVHLLVYGLPGSGKSTFAASAIDLGLSTCVLLGDALIKATPYRERVRDEELTTLDDGTLCLTGVGPTGKQVRILGFYEEDYSRPTAYARFQAQLPALRREVLNGAWDVVVVDTLSSFELLARYWHQFDLSKNVKEPRLWYAGATELLERLALGILNAFPSHVLILTHVDEDKDEVHGSFVRHPRAPGRLRTRLAEQWEIVRAYVKDTIEGKAVPPNFYLQTRKREGYYAAVQNRGGQALADPSPQDLAVFLAAKKSES